MTSAKSVRPPQRSGTCTGTGDPCPCPQFSVWVVDMSHEQQVARGVLHWHQSVTWSMSRMPGQHYAAVINSVIPVSTVRRMEGHDSVEKPHALINRHQVQSNNRPLVDRMRTLAVITVCRACLVLHVWYMSWSTAVKRPVFSDSHRRKQLYYAMQYRI